VKLLSDRRLVALLRVGLGVLFLAAAVPKLADPTGFAKAVGNYHLLPVAAERALALALPAIELIVGLALIAGVADAGASLLAFAMLLVFTLAIGAALARGLDISCGCFDTEGGSKVGLGKIAENLAFLLASWWVLIRDRSAFSLSGWLRRSGDIE
jgi:uncharacterized membrane protein YphA (DoxX/SURF4 family)